MVKHEERIRLSREQKAEMVSAIQNYFRAERDEELGSLAASLLLSFIVEELAPAFYNQGVNDAYRYACERNEDLLSILI